MELLKSIEKRRSIRRLGKDIKLDNEALFALLKHALKHTPSSFNSQSQRMMILLDKQHVAFWQLVLQALKKIVPEANFSSTETKIVGFEQGYGTILYFDDIAVTNNLTENFPLYKDNIINWAQQHNGMLQINIWNIFSNNNIGASLQHYTEVIEEKAKEVFDIPSSWKMIAQMPFGSIEEAPGQKEFVDTNTRLVIKE